jgi:hypothetical protein
MSIVVFSLRFGDSDITLFDALIKLFHVEVDSTPVSVESEFILI